MQTVDLDTNQTAWRNLPKDLLERFEERAMKFDEDDCFVQENYDELKKLKVFSAHVPPEFGGGGATYEEISDLLRNLAHSCGSTALALSMHTHLVAALVWRWQNQKAPVDGILKRIANENLVLVSSGGSDWLNGSGTAEKTEGGYLVSARKIFASGCPAGDLLMTMAINQDPVEGATVLHFPIDLKKEGVSIVETWRTLGMRGTGSNDIVIDRIFVPDQAIGVRRPQGKWHPSMHLVAMIALPLIYSVYTGLAEKAVEIALASARKRVNDDTLIRAGEMRTELLQTQIAHKAMVDLATSSQPGPETTDRVASLRTMVGRSAIATVEKAMEAAGGSAFYRAQGLERILRDVQAARYHPVQTLPQARYSGRFALGLSIDD